jgi:hypothetical protein
MRKKVREDQGHYETIDTAVYASIAALIKVRPPRHKGPAPYESASHSKAVTKAG